MALLSVVYQNRKTRTSGGDVEYAAHRYHDVGGYKNKWIKLLRYLIIVIYDCNMFVGVLVYRECLVCMPIDVCERLCVIKGNSI